MVDQIIVDLKVNTRQRSTAASRQIAENLAEMPPCDFKPDTYKVVI